MKVTINEKTGAVVIEGVIGEDGGPFESKSGKSVLLLNSGGTLKLDDVKYKGHPVSVNLSLMIPNPANAAVAATTEKAPKTKAKV